MLTEFSLINQYFKSKGVKRSDVALAIGDDAAITEVPAGMQLVSAIDTLVCGVHFPEHTAPFAIGYKSLAVNLSDLAAMGAQPAWALLAITLPDANQEWIEQFCDGFFQLADQHNVQLIGGDTTQGPLTITVQVLGLVPQSKAILRGGAKEGDVICVSGTLGDAAAALHVLRNSDSGELPIATSAIDELIGRLELPTPQVTLGIALREIATAAIDVSDGLVADLAHLLETNNLGATLFREKIPFSRNISAVLPLDKIDKEKQLLQWALYGGDDYELCFTIAADNCALLEKLSDQLNVCITQIGRVDAKKGIRLLNESVCSILSLQGYEHFSKS